jgi:UDP-glucose 4-epimerase
MSTKRILLTGGSGFVGRNIKESFLSSKYELIAPSSRELDCANDRSVERFFKQNRIDVIIHAAVKPSHRNAKDLSDIFYTNTRMFFNLERHCDSVEKMIVLGSGAIYDCRNYRPKVKEEEYVDFMPQDDHGYCKYVCEKVIEKSSNIYDLRIFGIFGKYEDYAIRFISNAICKALFDLPITIKQDRKFDYLFVDDLMPVIDWFITHDPKHKAYNVTPDTSISLLHLAELVRKISGKPDLSILISQDGMGLEYSGDNSLLRSEFPDLAYTPVEDAVKRLYDWYNESISQIDEKLLLIDR